MERFPAGVPGNPYTAPAQYPPHMTAMMAQAGLPGTAMTAPGAHPAASAAGAMMPPTGAMMPPTMAGTPAHFASQPGMVDMGHLTAGYLSGGAPSPLSAAMPTPVPAPNLETSSAGNKRRRKDKAGGKKQVIYASTWSGVVVQGLVSASATEQQHARR